MPTSVLNPQLLPLATIGATTVSRDRAPSRLRKRGARTGIAGERAASETRACRCSVAMLLRAALASSWLLTLATSRAVPSYAGAPSPGLCLNAGKKKRLKSQPTAFAQECCALCSATAGCDGWCWFAKAGVPTCNVFKGARAADTKPGACTSSETQGGPQPGPLAPATPAPQGAKNVLYLIVDDLRTQLGAYGHAETLTPNLVRAHTDPARAVDHDVSSKFLLLMLQ